MNYTFSVNRMSNPSGDEGLDHWTDTGSVTIDGGFKLTGAASITQVYTVSGTLTADIFRLSAKYKLSESMGRLYTGTPGYLQAIITYTDDTQQKIAIPLRADVIITRDVTSGWTSVSSDIDVDYDKTVKNVSVKAITYLTTQSITLKEISLKSGAVAGSGGPTDLQPAYDYTDSVLNDILADIETALGIILGTPP